MEIKEKIFKIVDKINDTYFFEYNIDVESVKGQLLKDIEFALNCEKDFNMCGMIALAIYRLSYQLVKTQKNKDLTDLFFKIKNETKQHTSSYLSPYSIIDCPVALGENVFIDKGFKINKCVIIGNYVIVIDKNNIDNDKRYTAINTNVYIGDNVKIYGGADIGEGCEIKDNCIIREPIASNNVVSVISELQFKKNKAHSYLPSQELQVYGIVPKYKNTFVLYGEGIYNPKVKLLVQNNMPVTEIAYWDKNKIIVKIKYFEINKNDKNKLIVFSNGQRVVLTNVVGLQKTLKNLQK